MNSYALPLRHSACASLVLLDDQNDGNKIYIALLTCQAISTATGAHRENLPDDIASLDVRN